jgi:hypothetical protein
MLCLAALIACAPPARAQFVLSPVAVLGTDLGVSDPGSGTTNLINGSGILTPFLSGATDFKTYFGSGGTAFARNRPENNWQSDFSFDLPLKGYIEFDLGAVYRVDGLGIWNVTLKEVTITLHKVQGSAPEVSSAFQLTNHINYTESYPPDVLSIGGSYEGRYLRIAVESAYTFSPSDTFAYAILGEVVVSASLPDTAVPPVLHLANTGGGLATLWWEPPSPGSSWTRLRLSPEQPGPKLRAAQTTQPTSRPRKGRGFIACGSDSSARLRLMQVREAPRLNLRASRHVPTAGTRVPPTTVGPASDQRIEQDPRRSVSAMPGLGDKQWQFAL